MILENSIYKKLQLIIDPDTLEENGVKNLYYLDSEVSNNFLKISDQNLKIKTIKYKMEKDIYFKQLFIKIKVSKNINQINDKNSIIYIYLIFFLKNVHSEID